MPKHLSWGNVINTFVENLHVPKALDIFSCLCSENCGFFKNPAIVCEYVLVLIPGVGYEAASDGPQQPTGPCLVLCPGGMVPAANSLHLESEDSREGVDMPEPLEMGAAALPATLDCWLEIGLLPRNSYP